MLTQTEADMLIAMEKTFMRPATISLPAGTEQTHELIGADKRERFLLDLWRGTLRLAKVKYQTRGRTVTILVRLDIDGAPHTNPDGGRLRHEFGNSLNLDNALRLHTQESHSWPKLKLQLKNLSA